MADHLKCNICDNEATVHLTQIVNNKIHKVDLCESCAQKKGVTNTEGFSLADLLSKAPLEPVTTDSDRSCPVCGYEAADFRKTGRFGCAACYSTFEDLVRPVLEDMHSGISHTGKVPELSLERQSAEEELQRLQKQLDRAVAEEAYEEAAKFRDEIQRLLKEKKEAVSKA